MYPSYWKGTFPESKIRKTIKQSSSHPLLFLISTQIVARPSIVAHSPALEIVVLLLMLLLALPSSMLLRRSRKLQILWVQSSQLAHHSYATPSHLAETGVTLEPQLGLGLGIRARRWVTRVLKRQRAQSAFLFSRLITQRRGFVQWKLEAATMSKRGTYSHPIHDDGAIFFEETFRRFLRGNFFHQFSEQVVYLLVLFLVSWRWTTSSYVRRS